MAEKTKAKETKKSEAQKPVEKEVAGKNKEGAESKEKTEKTEAKKKTYTITRTAEASKNAREKSRLEKKKGKFKRQNLGKKKRVPDRWRRPKGIDSGHRIDEKHKPAHPRSGYMTPKHVKGLDVTGFEIIRVFNVFDLDGLDSKTQAILIASAVGKKKRLEIQKSAQDKSIQILNYKE